jgi:uncharacterized protein (DUF1015 family)
VYVVEYRTPGASASGPGAGGKVRFTGFMALGRLHPFADGVVLPHERTFPKVVDDRLHLLAATRTHLESIFLLYSDPERSLDKLLESLAQGKPLIEVEARPGESHALYPVSDIAVFIRLMDFMSRQRPIIADGHHRYTTSLRYLDEISGADGMQAAAAWQMMTFTNLHGGGLSILATHRLAKLKREAVGDPVAAAWQALLARFEPAGPADADLTLETRDRTVPVRFPASLKAARRGVARTSYALLHDVVFGEWLGGRIDEATGVRYFKEATGEREALARGEGDILFRMKPVDPREFQAVVEGGEVFPHKTTYFYPKLWSGLVLWPIAEPVRLALK